MTNTNDPFASNDAQQTTPVQETPATPQNDPFADQLAQIRGDDGQPKYKDVGTALDALKQAQEFIPQLLSEKRAEEAARKELEAEVAKRKALEDYLNDRQPAQPAPVAETKATEGLNEADIAKLVQQQLVQNQTEQTHNANLQDVSNKLAEKFGDKTKDAVAAVVKQYGISADRLREDSKTNPQFVLKLFENVSVENAQPLDVAKRTTFAEPGTPKLPSYDRGIARGGFTDSELIERFRESRKVTNARLGVIE